MKRQGLIPNGYKWFNGHVLKDHQTEKYNYFSSEIDRYLSGPGGYDAFKDRIEHLLDMRCFYLKTCFEILDGEK